MSISYLRPALTVFSFTTSCSATKSTGALIKGRCQRKQIHFKTMNWWGKLNRWFHLAHDFSPYPTPYCHHTFHFLLCDSWVNIHVAFNLVACDQNQRVLTAGFIWSFQKYSHCNFEESSFISLIIWTWHSNTSRFLLTDESSAWTEIALNCFTFLSTWEVYLQIYVLPYDIFSIHELCDMSKICYMGFIQHSESWR